MASDKTPQNDKKISDSQKTESAIPSPEESPKTDVLDLEASALSDALEELTRLPEEGAKTPRIKELLQSNDAPSRFMTVLALVFAVLAVLTFSLLVTLYLKQRASHKKIVPVTEQVMLAPIVNEPLGEFKLFLAPENKEQVELRVEVVAECSTKEACEHLKDHLPQARDVVIPVLSAASREEFMSIDSKNLIRRRIAERLNSIPMEGKVLQVYFNEMTIE